MPRQLLLATAVLIAGSLVTLSAATTRETRKGDRPTICVYTTAGCQPCKRLWRDVLRSEALGGKFIWRYYGDRSKRPKSCRVSPMLYFKGAKGKTWRLEGWGGEKWFLKGWASVQ